MSDYLILSIDQVVNSRIMNSFHAFAELHAKTSNIPYAISYLIGYVSTALKYLYDFVVTHNIENFITGKLTENQFYDFLRTLNNKSHDHELRNAWNAKVELDEYSIGNLRSLREIATKNPNLHIMLLNVSDPLHSACIAQQMSKFEPKVDIPSNQLTYVKSFDEECRTSNLTVLTTTAIGKIKEAEEKGNIEKIENVININKNIQLPKIEGVNVITSHYDKEKDKYVGDYYQKLVRDNNASNQEAAVAV